MHFAINHITAANLHWFDFLKLAVKVGAVGVEFRNDLSSPLFSGSTPSKVGKALDKTGLKCLGLSQVYPFNAYCDQVALDVKALIKIAKNCGSQSISLIPRNDGRCIDKKESKTDLMIALREIKPMLEEAGIVGLIEPLGFESSSLRTKEEALNGIESVGGGSVFKIVHDTFHHFLAQETSFFAEQTAIIHVSGVVDMELAIHEMEDKHRVMVDGKDRLENVKQIGSLVELGYNGPISMECFAPEVYNSSEIVDLLQLSFSFLKNQLA